MRTSLLACLESIALVLSACGDKGGDEPTSVDPSTSSPLTTGDPMTTGAPSTGGDTPTSSDPSTSDDPSTGSDPSTGGDLCMTDICAVYGAAVPKIASDITDQAAVDPMFMADFAPIVAQGAPAVEAFKQSLANFITDAYACTKGAYNGPSMQAAHAGLGITQSEYDAFIALIAGVLANNGVPEDDITDCFAPPLLDPAFAATIINQ